MGPLLEKKRKEKRLGRLLHCVCFGPFGEREIGKFLTIVKAWTKHFLASFLGLG